MRIVQISHSYWPATYFGGPIFSTLGLCEALARRPDVELRVVSTDASGPSVKDRLPIREMPTRYSPGYDVYFVRQSLQNCAPLQIPVIWRQMRWADAVLLTGTYSFHVLPTLVFGRILRKPVAWSPRGAILDSHRWSGHRRPAAKRAFEFLCRVVAGSRTRFVVTSVDEAEAVRFRVGGVPVGIVSNGISVPTKLPQRGWRPNGRMRLMSIGRLDPKKGLENLISALAQSATIVSLDIFGQGRPEYEIKLRKHAENLGVADRVFFRGHVDADEKMKAFADADLFVLPSHSENFGMVVAEALAHGVPAIVSRAAPWSDLQKKGAGLWVENTPDSLALAVAELQSKDLSSMGAKGREWMQAEFSWDSRAEMLLAEFDQIASPSSAQADSAKKAA